MRAGELAPSLASYHRQESWPWWRVCRSAGRLTNSATTQAQIQDSEMTHHDISPIHELLVFMKGLVLQNQSCRVSMTQGNNRTSEKSPGEDLVLIVYQKPEASNQTMTHCNGHWQEKRLGKVVLYLNFQDDFFLCFLLWGRLQGRGQMWRDGEMSGIRCMMWSSQRISKKSFKM